MYNKLSDREEFLGSEIVDAAFKVHKELGPGLLEKIYEACFCFELEKKEFFTTGRLNCRYFIRVSGLTKG